MIKALETVIRLKMRKGIDFMVNKIKEEYYVAFELVKHKMQKQAEILARKSPNANYTTQVYKIAVEHGMLEVAKVALDNGFEEVNDDLDACVKSTLEYANESSAVHLLEIAAKHALAKFLASKCRYYFAAEAFAICAKYGFREGAMAVATNCGAYKATEAFKTAIDHGMWEEAMVLSLKSVVDEAIDIFMTAAKLYKRVTSLDESGCGDSKVLLALKLAIEAGLDREAELLAERCNGQDAVAALEFAVDRGLHKVMELLIARCYSDNVLVAFMVVATRGLSNEAVMLAKRCTVSSVCEMFDIAMKHRLYEAVKILGITRNKLNVEASVVRSVKVSTAHIRNKYATRSKRKLPLNTQTPQ